MSIIDRQRIAAVKSMEALGYSFDGIAWTAPEGNTPPPASLAGEADAMHSLLVLRADKLEGCTEGSDEAAELKMIAETLEAYECKRWPDGVERGGKSG